MLNNLVVLDCEVYRNLFLICFKFLDTSEVLTFKTKDKLTINQIKQIKHILKRNTTFGFNSINYDIPIITLALNGETTENIYKMSNKIIEKNLKGWQTLKAYNLLKPKINHFDIQEIAPGVRVSLKLYGGRIHSSKLQDLPYEPVELLTDEQIKNIETYCINDLDTTIDLYNTIKDRVKLRFDMSKQYGDEVLSKSDAQIAEVVIKKELSILNPYLELKAPKIPKDKVFKYKIPDFIFFESDILKEALETIKNSDFVLDDKGSMKLPKEIKDLKIKLGKSIYQLGIGGIHSCEKSQSIIPNNNYYLVDKDVASYYPSIILNLKLFPKNLGLSFIKVYGKIVKQRLKAKKEGNKILNESLKIVINGSFGKFGNKYSTLYSPDLMINTTLTGQLSLLMLIEQLEMNGFSVVSANTDGFVTLVDKDRYDLYEDLCLIWEINTGFILETTKYKSLYSRDVNNYLAITDDNFKGKGIFTLNQLSKNPQADIIILSIINYLRNNIPIDETIKSCKDITKFLFVRSVTGGAIWKNNYLGRVVRWVYCKKGDTINYKKNGNKVPKSDGARPIMDLNNFSFENLDYERYIDEAIDVLYDLGLTDFLKDEKPKRKRKVIT